MVKPVEVRGINTDTEQDLREVWNNALEEYARITEKAKPASGGSFDSLIVSVRSEVDQSSSRNKSKAKDVLWKVARCLQNFGGMVASAASMVFGPANQCYNAINFVINAAKGCQDLIDGYIALLEHCSAFLERVVMHLESTGEAGEVCLPMHMRRPVYEGLNLFLKIQAHSRNLATSKRAKFKSFCGVVLFSEDDGVKDNLAALHRFSTNLTDCTVDTIMEDVKGLAKHLHRSTEDRKKYEDECRAHFQALGYLSEKTLQTVESSATLISQLSNSEDDKANMRKIEQALPSGTELGKKFDERHKAYQKERIEGTGQWLLESPDFQLWTKSQAPQRLLLLTGNRGAGKSYLCSHVIDHITAYSRDASQQRIHLAFYYVEKGADLQSCLASLVWQLASQDKIYARAAASACTQAGALGNASRLWKTLVDDLAGSMQGHYFLVIDGYAADMDGKVLEGIAEKAILSSTRQSTSTSSTSSLRLFISGQQEDLQPLLRFEAHEFKLGDSGPPPLLRQPSRDLDELTTNATPVRRPPILENEKDLSIFITHHISKLCEQRKYLQSTLQDPKLDIQAKLLRSVRGDYIGLEGRLKELAQAQNEETIEDIINRPGESAEDAFQRVRIELHDRLTAEEIRELNVLLQWVYEGSDCSAQFLQVVLQWKTKKKYFVESHVTTKFSRILRIDAQGVVSPQFEAEVLRGFAVNNQVQQFNKRSASAAVEIQQCEIDIIKHFVSSYCSPELYQRFKFEDFFNDKITDPWAKIRLDDTNAVNASILQTCLDALCTSVEDEDFEKLRAYAREWLGQHLLAVNLYKIDLPAVEKIAMGITSIIWDPQTIDTCWKPIFLNFSYFDWFQDDDVLNKIVEILSYPPVADLHWTSSEQSEWIKAAISEKGHSMCLLVKVVERLASYWVSMLRGENRILQASMYCLYKIWDKDDESDIYADASVEQLNHFIEFVENVPSQSLSQLQISTHKTTALYYYSYNTEALEAGGLAEQETGDGPRWPLNVNMAQIHFELNNYVSALEYLNKMEADYMQAENPDSEHSKAYWTTALLLIACSHKKLEDADAATVSFFKLLDHKMDDDFTYVHAEAVTELFDMWSQSEKHDMIVGQIQKWRKTKNISGDHHYWLPQLSESQQFHYQTVLAAVKTALHEEVGDCYEDAISKLREKRDDEDAIEKAENLSLYRALILFHGSSVRSDKEKALTMWDDLVLASASKESSVAATKSIKLLSRYLLDMGLALNEQLHGGPLNQQETASAALQDVLKRLEELATRNSAVLNSCRRVSTDPRLALARLYFKIGNEKACNRIVIARLQKDFEDWPTATDSIALSNRYDRIAHMLTVINDDANAVAAWQMMALPFKKGQEDDDEDASTDNGEDDAADNDDDAATEDNEDAATEENEDAATEDSEGAATDDVDPSNNSLTEEDAKCVQDDGVREDSVVRVSTPDNSDNSPQTDGSEESSAPPPAGNDNDTTKAETTEPADQEGDGSSVDFKVLCGYFCDGVCDTKWSVMEDLHACRNCIQLQLCSDCHDKLLEGKLPPTICDAKHDFLYVPKIDRPAWEKLDKGMMIVAGETISTDAWLERLREQWELKQDQIEARRIAFKKFFRKAVRCYLFVQRYYQKDKATYDDRRIREIDGVFTWV